METFKDSHAAAAWVNENLQTLCSCKSEHLSQVECYAYSGTLIVEVGNFYFPSVAGRPSIGGGTTVLKIEVKEGMKPSDYLRNQNSIIEIISQPKLVLGWVTGVRGASPFAFVG